MIQDIAPHVMHNEYKPRDPRADDYVFSFDGNNVHLNHDNLFFQVKDLPDQRHLDYLFRIDDTAFFLSDLKDLAVSSINTYNLRTLEPKWLSFAAITGWQIDAWMQINKRCGRCGHLMVKDTRERAMRCPSCGNLVYPRIMPAVIVAVINDNGELLVTKYAHGRYQKYALVAGYNEIGESIEQTAIREVKEETGLDVGSLTYYKSQPWGFTSTLLFGFYAHVIGSDAITMGSNELRVARWVKPTDEIDTGGNASLTSEMIHNFIEDSARRPLTSGRG